VLLPFLASFSLFRFAIQVMISVTGMAIEDSDGDGDEHSDDGSNTVTTSN